MPTSSAGCAAVMNLSAAWRAQGPGIISVDVVAAPRRRASMPASVAAWVEPMRSALRINSLWSSS